MKSDNERKDTGKRYEEEDLNIFVSDLLHQMTTKFDYMGNQIMVSELFLNHFIESKKTNVVLTILLSLYLVPHG
jgi:hypothetical protein